MSQTTIKKLTAPKETESSLSALETKIAELEAKGVDIEANILKAKRKQDAGLAKKIRGQWPGEESLKDLWQFVRNAK